jgi:sec-independent protein translocase protein TatA
MPNGPELFVVLGVLLLLFGAPKIPQFARSLGQAQREFRKGSTEDLDKDDDKKDSKPST